MRPPQNLPATDPPAADTPHATESEAHGANSDGMSTSDTPHATNCSMVLAPRAILKRGGAPKLSSTSGLVRCRRAIDRSQELAGDIEAQASGWHPHVYDIRALLTAEHCL